VIALLGLCGPAAALGRAPLAAAAPPPRPTVISAERAAVTATGNVTAARQAGAVRYWSRARMAAARSVDAVPGSRARMTARNLDAVPGARAVMSAGPWVAGARWTEGGAVTRTTGRVFFTLDGTDYSCSGSTVDSANADVVITAAHCVSDGQGTWATHWIFVPGYDDGHEPYGAYPARAFFAASGWQHGADENDDVAFVAVGPASRGSGSGGMGFDRKQARLHVADVVGGQQIKFGSRAATEMLFGYPSVGQYHGRYLDYCDGALSADPYGSPDAGVACTMTEGASGGPWFSGFDPLTGLGTITGVTTFRYSGSGVTLYSLDLGSAARTLYDQAQRA
jgi:V8-like Glu-specific endopeptidase